MVGTECKNAILTVFNPICLDGLLLPGIDTWLAIAAFNHPWGEMPAVLGQFETKMKTQNI